MKQSLINTKNIQNNKKPKIQKNLKNENSIITYAKNNNFENLLSLLKKDNSKINLLNKEGISLLHISIIKGNLDIMNALLLNGANPNILSSRKKQTPFCIYL